MSEYMPYAPDPLTVHGYNHLRIRMLGKAGLSPALVKANILFEPTMYRIGDPDHWNEDYSFAGQMNTLHNAPYAPTAADTFVLTEYSAIPVADAIRGYYDAAALPRPRIISCPRQLTASAAFHPDPDIVSDFSTQLSDSRHAVVIDQFVHTGRTLMQTCRTVIGAGVPYVTAVRGSWYQRIEKPTDDEYQALTSPHALVMYELGRQAVLNI